MIQVIAEAEEYYLPFENERDLLQLQARAEKRKAALKDYVHQFLFQHEYEQYLDAAQQEGLRIVDAKDISLGTDIEGIGNVDVLKRTILSAHSEGLSLNLKTLTSLFQLFMPLKKKPKSYRGPCTQNS